jgi:hypothetical protein
MPTHTRNVSRNRQIQKRNDLRAELNNFISQSNSLRAEYDEKKPGQATLWNVYGFFATDIKNPARLALISEIERVAGFINTQLSKMEFSDSPSGALLSKEVSQLEILKNTLIGAIATHKQDLFDATNGYVCSADNSELYTQLNNLLPAESGTTVSERAEYQKWLANNPETLVNTITA